MTVLDTGAARLPADLPTLLQGLVPQRSDLALVLDVLPNGYQRLCLLVQVATVEGLRYYVVDQYILKGLYRTGKISQEFYGEAFQILDPLVRRSNAIVRALHLPLGMSQNYIRHRRQMWQIYSHFSSGEWFGNVFSCSHLSACLPGSKDCREAGPFRSTKGRFALGACFHLAG